MNNDWLYKRSVIRAAWVAAGLMFLIVLMAGGRNAQSGVRCPAGLQYNASMARCEPIPTPVPHRVF